MAVLRTDYTGCTVLLYDNEGERIDTDTVAKFSWKTQEMHLLKGVPKCLSVGDSCRLLILINPMPHEYQGKVVKDGMNLFYAVFKGSEKESRKAARYTLNSPAFIETYVCDDTAHKLFSSIEINLVNISKSGVRFRAPFYTLLVDDIFQMLMKIGDNDKLLTAQVINYIDKDGVSEYGCLFLDKEV